jgi:signal transduction histidine kinase
MKSLLKNSYYKVRIIFTFALVTVMLVIVMALVSYYFVKDIYLGQLTENLDQSSQLIGSKFDDKYLGLLKLGKPVESVQNYFTKITNDNLNPNYYSELFLFDKDFNVVVHSDHKADVGSTINKLYINQKEILSLKVNESISSLPFKGNDGNWYLWGFYKINDYYWFAIKASASKLAAIDSLANLFWLIGAVGIFITIILGWFIARSVINPLNRLINYSAEIGKGNFDAPAPAEMKGEIAKLSDALIKMKDDLVENQKERENLLAQIAHEIRNPLGGIELLTNLVKEDIAADIKSEKYLNKILDELKGLKSLITSFLNFSRPMPASAEWVSIKETLNDVTKIFETRLKQKAINLDLKISADKIWFDRSHLKQVLVNIISNSVESIDSSGEIKINSDQKNGSWILSIADNGKGINENDLGKIFEPFFTTKKDGTGLGLPISKKLCYSNKADLLVESSKLGSTFSIIKKIVNEN